MFRASIVVGIASLALALTSCSVDDIPFVEDRPDESSTPIPSAKPSVVPADQVRPESKFELRYVRKSAPPCAATWIAGARLPVNYEWCVGDSGSPVAGVRMGSCEVVSYESRLYGVPGYQIRAVRGTMTTDPGYLRELTDCKRAPYRRDPGPRR